MKNNHLFSLPGIVLTFLVLANSSFVSVADPAVTPQLMKKALPVWAEGREKEMNLNLGFCGVFHAADNQICTLRITASTLYRLSVNGEFIGYGPARACHGYYRVDEYDLSKKVKSGENIVAIEVAGYNVNSYYTMDQPSFLEAEVESGTKVVLATGTLPGFSAFPLRERLQKVERYSFQRPFTEYYRLNQGFDQWKVTGKIVRDPVKLATSPAVKLLPRNLMFPPFDLVRPVSESLRGTVEFKKQPGYHKDRSLTRISAKFKGYREEELEVLPSQLIQEMSDITRDTVPEQFMGKPLSLQLNGYATFDFGIDLTGFIGAKIRCTEPSKVCFYFDEVLTKGDVNTKKRMRDVNNQIVYELEPGIYNLESFEPYTFKYLKLIVLKGSCTIDDLYLREYAGAGNPKATFNCTNEKLNAIYKASGQSFRQNAVDIFTDCPSRERAGWLCDSYFTAIMEKDYTGRSAVAHNFYENYALPDSFAFLPKGMVPMCYPADHNDGVFIPNWALWFVLQVNDYAQRGGDPVLIERLKPKVEGVLNYFAPFENSDGLLEKLQSWIFVEWSKANSFVQDVNYPTNMLYSEALARAAKLYHNDSWRKKSEHIKQKVLDQSYNGTFFVDNAIRNKNGKLEPTSNTTEVCQYYAFYFNIATPATHPGLWKKLISGFGPERDEKVTYPNVFRANAFVGNYLRMDILSRYGLKNQLLKEIQDYFYGMAKITGTLWENMGAEASCNHGFASWLGHVLYRDILGVDEIDYLQKVVTIRFGDIGLTGCSGTIPVDDSAVELNWKRSGKQISYSVKVPQGYQLKVINDSSSSLVSSEKE